MEQRASESNNKVSNRDQISLLMELNETMMMMMMMVAGKAGRLIIFKCTHANACIEHNKQASGSHHQHRHSRNNRNIVVAHR